MQQETQQRTSQGEYITPFDNKLEVKEEGLLSGIWHKMVGTTEAAAHKAGEAVHSLQESTSELLDKGLEKAHDVVMAGEEFIEAEVEKASTFIHDTKPSDVVEKAQSTAVGIGASIHEFASIIVEQAKELNHTSPAPSPKPSQSAVDALVARTEEVFTSLASIISPVAHQVGQTVGPAVETAKDVVTPVAEKVVEAAAPVVEKAKEVVVPVVEKALEAAAPVVERAVEAAAPAMEKAKEVAAPVVERAVEVAAPVMEKAKELAAPVVDIAAPVVEKAKDAVTPVVEKVVDVVAEKMGDVAPMKRSNSNRSLKKSPSKQSVNLEHSNEGWNSQALVLTMDVVSHVQRIADRTGDAVLHETARRAHSACAKGLSEAPGVHLTWITPQQANDLVNLAIRTQDHELADFARYCQSVAATTHIGVEPTPGKIQEEILKGYQELQKQGRVHIGPGYGAAFASVNKTYPATEGGEPLTHPNSLSDADPSTLQKRSGLRARPVINEQGSKGAELELTMDVVAHVQRIADRTGNAALHATARRAHSAFAKNQSEAPGVHLARITPTLASELMNLASKSADQDLIDFARYCQSVASTTQVGVEPTPGKIQQEILKAQELQQSQQSQQQSTEQPIQAMSALE